jgi:hypothetical protein
MIPELGFAVAWFAFCCVLCLFERPRDSASVRTAKRIARYALTATLGAAVALALLALWATRQ